MTKAEEYSFNIESILFQYLTKEQQRLWRKEIEQAYNAGAEWQEQKDTGLLQEAGIVIVPEEHFERMKRSLIQLASKESKSLWKPADGDKLPEIDREVIVLYQRYPLEGNEYAVGFGHRPKEYWEGKNISTGEVTRYYPKKYDKGGWNSPNIKWWLDLDLPIMEE